MIVMSNRFVRLDADKDIWKFLQLDVKCAVDLRQIPDSIRMNVIRALRRGYISASSSATARIYELLCEVCGLYPVMRGRYEAKFPVAKDRYNVFVTEVKALLMLVNKPGDGPGLDGKDYIGWLRTFACRDYLTLWVTKPPYIEWTPFVNLYEKFGLINSQENIDKAINYLDQGAKILLPFGSH